MFCALITAALAQSPGQHVLLARSTSQSESRPESRTPARLVRVQTITAASEEAEALFSPEVCDEDGNFYFPKQIVEMPAIHKLNPKGRTIASFEPSAKPDVPVNVTPWYAVERDGGNLYQLVLTQGPDKYIYVYKSDGRFKSAVKLEAGFMFQASKLATFPNGEFLISGDKFDTDKRAAIWPFTGIFAADGRLIKQVDLEDDTSLHDMAAAGDNRVVRAEAPQSNLAINFGALEVGEDGNAYLMRWTNPAIFYAISAGGEVVRRFTVDPGDLGYRPRGFQLAKNRVSVLFWNRETDDRTMRVVDVEGNDVATYDDPKNERPRDGGLGLSFACYTENPTRWTFFESDDEHRLQLQTVEPSSASVPTSVSELPLPAQASSAPSPIMFDEVAKQAGVNFVLNNSASANKNQPESVVGGVALLDFDGDGYLDIYFVNGAAIPSLQKDGAQYKNRLYHNNRDGTFTDVTDKAGVGGDGFDIGVAVGDYDNDGRPDIYTVGLTRNHLYHNNGDGTFTDVTDKAGVPGGVYDGSKKMWSVAAAWVDYNNDGRLDLFVSNYVKWEVNKDPLCVMAKVRSYCSPDHYEELPNTLYRNNGDGTFTDVSQETGIAKYTGRGMGVAIADYDGDGFIDIFVANDGSRNLLFHNLGGKKFEEVGVAAGVAYTQDGRIVSGMGANFVDVNNDGRPDIWMTALPMQTFPLYLNRGGGEFENVSERTGLAWQTLPMSGWSNAVVDLDNDGWKDLFAARSDVLDTIEQFSSRRFASPNVVLRNQGNGKFKDVSATAGDGFQLPAVHRGSAVGDLDNDGRMDVVVAVANGPAKIFHNVTQTTNHWLLLQLRGTKSNRMGIGAQVRLTAEDGSKQYSEVTTSVGYASSSDSRVHFGLGASKTAKEIEILWPSGIRQVLKDVAGDKIVTIDESSAASPAASKK
jgi:hypothetical protein